MVDEQEARVGRLQSRGWYVLQKMGHIQRWKDLHINLSMSSINGQEANANGGSGGLLNNHCVQFVKLTQCFQRG